MGVQQVQAKPLVVEAMKFDGTEKGAKEIRRWAIERGAAASFFWSRGSWNDQSPEPAVRVQGLVVEPGSWVVAGTQWQVLLSSQFEASYSVVDA